MHFSLSDIKKKVQDIPRKELIQKPTPFYKLENLTQALDGPEIFIKRDDLTGLAFGGNKSRKLEFIIQDVLDKGADVIITWASIQSNWCLQTAAAARKFGIKPILVLFKTYDLPDDIDGNLLLDYILDADVKIRDAEGRNLLIEEDVKDILEDLAASAIKEGHSPYIAPIGGSMVGGSMELPLGAIGYVQAFVEMMEQAKAMDTEVDYVIHASGSGSTQAGLVVGSMASGGQTKVLGISISEEKETHGKDVLVISRDTLRALGIKLDVHSRDIKIFDEYIGEGYGVVDKDVSETVRLVAFKEGIFLDPVYTGKAMAGLLDLIKKGYFKKDDRIVFFHTGGTPALFPYKHLLLQFLNAKTERTEQIEQRRLK